MNRNDKSIKVMLVILIVVCLFQGCSISSLNTSVNDLSNGLMQAESKILTMQQQILELEENATDGNLQMDVSYKTSKINLDTGRIEVTFTVNPVLATESTRIIIGNGSGSFELIKDGNIFSGIVEYPLDTSDFETVAYQYEGEFEKGYQSIDWINAGMLLMEYVGCDFSGYASYGNDKLTLAGELTYGMYLKEEISSVKMIAGEKITELENATKGTASVNLSEYVGDYDSDSEMGARFICVEFTTADGIIYRVYPGISVGSSYQVGNEVAMEGPIKGGYYFTQENGLMIMKPDGTKYETRLFSKSEWSDEW